MMGLASGMDTDFIIQQTLRMHQFKIDNQLRNRRLIEWRQQTHNTIKDEIQNLRTTFLSNLGSKTMMNRQTYNATKATTSGANSSAVSIRTNAGSPLGNFSINSVAQLARGQHLTTATGVTGADGNGFATNARLGDMVFGNGEKISWTHQGTTVRVGNEDVKIERTNGGEWTFKDRNGSDVAATWNGSSVTIGAGGTTRTLNLVENVDGSRHFTENRQGVFEQAFTVGAQDGHPERNFTVTASFADGNWSFSSTAGGVAALDGNGNLTVRFGSGANQQVVNLGEWKGDTQPPNIDGALTPFTQSVSTVANMAGEARLIFNTTGEDVNVLIRATDSLSEMLTRVNQQAGVNMSYDRLSDQFTLEARTGNNINPETTQLGIFSHSNFFNIIRGDVASTEPLIRDGQQSISFINGEEVRRNTNNFDFRGVTVTLNHTFNADYKPLTAAEIAGMTTQQKEAHDAAVRAASVNINLSRDTDQAFNAIKEFIDSYNSIIKRLEGLLNERKTGNEVSYKPLTDEEKQGMTDRQIEEWEAIARKGILRGDQGIQNLVSNLRRSFFEEIEGTGINPSQLGLTTGSFFDGTGGQIVINEERLRAAIENDPDMVADVFIRIDNTGTGTRGVGLMYKIDGLMRDYVNTSQPISTKSLEDSLKRVNEQIERMQARMFAEEDRLYRVFAQMETAMQRLQQQGGWFNAMLGG